MIKRTAILFFAALLGACAADNEPVIERVKIPAQALAVGGQLPVISLTGDALAQPGAAAWAEFPEHQVELSLAPPVHPSINLRHESDTPTVPAYVQSASDGQRLYIRLRWPDVTKSTATSREEFADGAAVQFALDAGAATSFMMGAAAGPVNIWYWKAGREDAQNLAAGGFGSTTVLDPAGLKVATHYSDGQWTLVFSRALAADGDYLVDFSSLTGHIALALWQGDTRQRDGLKHVTMGWIELGVGK
jgi:dimethylsulfide dehydrogenase subunit gamma